MKNKKILYAASTYGHIRSFHLPYVEALREKGAFVKTMARGSESDFDIPFEKKLFSRKNGECRKRIREIIESEGFDAIILNTSLAAYQIRRALPRRCRARVINVVHGYLFSRHVGLVKRISLFMTEWLLRRRTDTVITMNAEDYCVAKRYRLGRSVINCRGMGASLRPVITSPESIRREYFPCEAFVMSFVGEYSKRKNQEFLIRALSEMKPHIPEAVLCLVGEGDERARLEDLICNLGLTESVILTGRRSDACDFIRASDLYVSASVIEGMPFNVIEALGACKTVLVSDVKGHADLIEDGVSGYLYEWGNMGDFVNKACQIYRESPLPPEKIAERYLEYEKEKVFPETLSIIEDAVLGR